MDTIGQVPSPCLRACTFRYTTPKPTNTPTDEPYSMLRLMPSSIVSPPFKRAQTSITNSVGDTSRTSQETGDAATTNCNCPSRRRTESERFKFGTIPYTLIIYTFFAISGRSGRVAVDGIRRSGGLFCSAFVSAQPSPPAISRYSSSTDTLSDEDMASCEKDVHSSKRLHSNDSNLWLYHVESTTSTMDEAKRLVEGKFIGNDKERDSASNTPTSFLISATSQSNGRGTTQRNWKSSQRGNALFTIGISQSAWMNDLKSRNGGRMVPLTLLPLKVGSVVASRVQQFVDECLGMKQSQDAMRAIRRATVKWPNDVLLRNEDGFHEKVAGILIESSQDWFLVGIGINVGYAPDIPCEGVDYGRKATCLSQYCHSGSLSSAEGTCAADDDVENCNGTNNDEEHWIEVSKKLARDVAYDLHSWLHPSTASTTTAHSGETILNEWKSFVDWDMELILRDTPTRERVTLKQVLEDGRVVVQEIETGSTRTLVSDYFL